jgi:enoyl-CoA hydratase
MSVRYLSVQLQGAVATVALKRPRAANRINQAMALELAETCAELDAAADVRVVVITGEGASFSVGWEPVRRGSALVQVAQAVSAVRKPVVAAINGDCLDQGLELALACDFRVTVPEAHFGIRHVASGLMPWDGGTQRLPRLVGRPQAIRLLLTAEVIDSQEALHMGLVHHIATDGDLHKSVAEITRRLLDGAPIAAAYAKEAAMSGMDLTLDQGLRLEADLSILLHGTQDRAEGLSSFHERRKPRYLGQ